MKGKQKHYQSLVMALFCMGVAGGIQAADLTIQSLDRSGRLTFSRISSGEVYRIESTDALTGTWTRLTSPAILGGIPTTLDCIPGKGSGIVTCAVPIVADAVFYRCAAEVGGMALIPAGSFVMGATTNVGHEMIANSVPQHTVTVSAFAMDRYRVTKAKWDEVYVWATTNGYAFQNVGSGKATNHPVHTVSWYDCVKWCNARSEREGYLPCYTTTGVTYKTGTDSNVVCNWSASGYRLPTEAEWEKAARGGVADHLFPWCDTNVIQHARANYIATTNKYSYDGNTNGYTGTYYHPTYKTGSQPYTNPVDAFAPNGYGIYDMAGNLFDWCWDWYSDAYYSGSPDTDPTGPAGPLTTRVTRGGSWANEASAARCANRGDSGPGGSWNGRSFRCVRRP